MADAERALVTGLVAAVRSAIAPVEIYPDLAPQEETPVGASFPYVTFEVEADDDSSKTERAQVYRVSFDVASRSTARDYGDAIDIAGQLYDLLHVNAVPFAAPFAVTGWNLWQAVFIDKVRYIDKDGITRHIAADFLIGLEEQ